MSSPGVQAVEGARADHAILFGREVNARENLASLPGYSPSLTEQRLGLAQAALLPSGRYVDGAAGVR